VPMRVWVHRPQRGGYGGLCRAHGCRKYDRRGVVRRFRVARGSCLTSSSSP
jgi:hypothetical protein